MSEYQYYEFRAVDRPLTPKKQEAVAGEEEGRLGFLVRLYRFEDESTSKFKDWVPDAPGTFAEEVVVWKTGSPSRADIKVLRTFIKRELFGWGARLAYSPPTLEEGMQMDKTQLFQFLSTQAASSLLDLLSTVIR